MATKSEDNLCIGIAAWSDQDVKVISALSIDMASN
jgi:hypothetical protein